MKPVPLLLCRLLPLAACLFPLTLRGASEKAAELYEVLRKRPASAPVLEQLQRAWLESDTLENLDVWLRERAEESLEGRMVLAAFLQRRGAVDEAREEWQRVTQEAPARAEAWRALAQMSVRIRNDSAALAAITKGLAAAPDVEGKRPLLELQARLLARGQQQEEARKVWDELLRLFPNDQDLREHYVELLAESGQADAAVQAARALADATTDGYRRVLRRMRAGDLLSRQGAAEAALAEYRAALRDTGAGSWLERDLLRQMESALRSGDAVAYLEKFVSEEPQRLSIRRRLAELLTRQGKQDAADAHWSALLAAAPGDKELTEARILILTESGRHAAAAEHWRALIKLHPADAELHLRLAAALHAAKDEAACAAAVRGFIQAKSATEDATLRGAAELLRFKLPAEAALLLAETVQKFPDSEQAALQLATARHRAGKVEEARTAWRTAAQRHLLPAARAASAAGEHALAWELVAPRSEEFARDPAALTFLSEAAGRAEQWPAALAQARRLLALAQDAPALEHAAALVRRCAAQSEQTDALRQELESRRAALTATERLLLADLQNAAGMRSAAVALVEEVSAAQPALSLTMLVRLHSEAQDWPAAIAAQTRLHRSETPPRPATAQRLAELCTSGGHHADALTWTAEWRRLAPGSVAPWLHEATLMERAGRRTEAIRLVEQASFRWPDDTDVLARLAHLYGENGRHQEALDLHLRLFDLAQSTEEKLRRLPPMIRHAQSTMHRLDVLTEEFERRRAQDRLSPAPLLALAEIAGEQQQSRRRLELLHEAARLGHGDAALLMRTAQAAAAEGFTDLALSMLADAAALDKSGAADQQRALLLLQSGKQDEAGVLLARAAEVLTLEEACETAAILSQQGYHTAAAQVLGPQMERHPENYRLAWLRAELLRLGGRTDGLVEEYVCLATMTFPSLPVREESDGATPFTMPGGPALEPDFDYSVREKVSPDTHERWSFVNAAARRQQSRGSAADQLPAVPGLPSQLRGWAVRRAVEMAHLHAPDTVPPVQAQLLKAGRSVALIAPHVIQRGQQPDRGELDRLYAQYPDHRAWLLRYIYGELRVQGPVITMQLAAAEWQPDYAAAAQEDVPRPSFAEAWRTFRGSDPAYAVYVALQLLHGPAGTPLTAAEEALALLEQPGGPGTALQGAIPHMGMALTNLRNEKTPLLQRLASHIEAWSLTAPPGPQREELMRLRLAHSWNGDDPAAHLKLVASLVEESSGVDVSKVHLAPWPIPASRPAQTMQGGGWPVSFVPDGVQLPAPGAWLLQVPPYVHQPAARGRLLHAAALLVPGKWSADAAKLRAALEACDDAGLRAVASLALNDAAFTTACMERLATAADAPREALLFATAWAWRQRQPDKAVAFLERHAALEPTDAPRLADTGIVAAAQLLLWAGEPVSEAIHRAAATALERLSAPTFSAEMLRSLARLAVKLNLPERDAALRAAAAALPPPAHTLPQHLPPPAPPHALTGLIESLRRSQESAQTRADQLPNDPAAWVQSLMDQAKMAAEEGGQRPQPNLELNGWALRERKALRLSVLKELRHRADHAPQPRDRWFAAFALLGCDDVEFAAAALSRACALLPDEKKLHSRAASYLASTGQLAPAKALAAGLSRYQRAAALAAALAGHQRGIPHMAAALSLAEEWLAALRDLHDHADAISNEDRSDAINNGHNLERVLETLESKQRGRELPGLAGFLETPTEEHLAAIKEDAELAALATRRRELLIAIYRELIRSPFAPAIGFTKMESAARVHNLAWPERLDDALHTLIISTAGRLHWYSNSGQYAPQQAVLRELVRRPAWLEEKVLPALRAAKHDQLAESLVRLAPLLTCSEDEFIRLVTKDGGPSSRESRADYGTTVLEIITQRKLTGVLPELIAREVGEQLGEWYGSPGMTKMIGPAVEVVYARGGQAAIDAWVHEVCGEFRAEDIWTRPVGPEAAPGAGFTRLLQAARSLSNDATGVLAGARLMRALRAAAAKLPARAVAKFLQPAEPHVPPKGEPAEIATLLEILGCAGSAAEFCAALADWNAESKPEQALPRFSEWLQRLERPGDGKKPGPLEEVLAAKFSETFGGQFCAALLADGREKRGDVPSGETRVPNAHALRVLGTHLAAVQALPEADQMLLAALPAPAPQQAGKKAPVPDGEALAAHQWLLALSALRDRKRIEDLLALPAQELMANHGLQQELTGLAQRMLPGETDRVIDLLKHVRAATFNGSPGLVPQIIGSPDILPHRDGGRAAAAARLRIARKLSAAAPDLGLPPGLWSWPFAGELRVWLGEAEGKETLARFIEGVESFPDDLLTEADARSLLPELMHTVRSFTEYSDEYEAVPAAVVRLRGAGPGGALRRVAATALALGALHRERREAVSRVQASLMEESRKKGGPEFEPQHFPTAPQPALTDAALLPEAQRELLALLQEGVQNAAEFSYRVARCVDMFPRLFDPPLYAAAVALLPGVQTPQARKNGAVLAAALAAVPPLFTPPEDGSERAQAAQLLEYLLPVSGRHPDGDLLRLTLRSGNEAKVLEAVRALCLPREGAVDLAPGPLLRALVNHRQFAAAQWVLENGGERLFAPGFSPRSPDELFLPQTPQALRDFQAALPAGPLSAVARVLIESALDAPALGGAGPPVRAERMRTLAAALPLEPLPLAWVRRMQAPFRETELRQPLASLMAKAVADMPVEELLTADDKTRRVYMNHLAREAQSGRREGLTKALTALQAAGASQVAEELLAAVRGTHILPANRPADAESAARATMRRGALGPAQQVKDNPARRAYALAECLAIHAAADAMSEMEAAWQALPAEQRAALEALPQVVPYILQRLRDPATDRFSAGALPAHLIDHREDALVRLVQSTFGLPGFLPGDLFSWEVRESAAFSDGPPRTLPGRLCSLAPELSARRDPQALTVLGDIALLLVREKKPDEARKYLPMLAEALAATPPARRVPAFAVHFELRKMLDGTEPALAWALKNAAMPDAGLTANAGRAVASLHTTMNLADAALLKSEGHAAWEKSAAARLAAAPESALALLHAAFVLEKTADALAVADKHAEALAAISLALQTAERAARRQPALLDAETRGIFLANYADLAQRAGQPVETAELVPVHYRKWQSRAVTMPRLTRGVPRPGEWMEGPAPLGWNAPGVATVITVIPAERLRQLEAKAEFKVEAATAGTYGCLFSAVSGTDAPFVLNSTRLAWSDGGRPERTPPLEFLSADRAAARATPNARLTICGPQWLREGANTYGFTLFQPEQVADSFYFDAALYALKLTWPEAVTRAAKNSRASEFIKSLPEWMTRENQ